MAVLRRMREVPGRQRLLLLRAFVLLLTAKTALAVIPVKRILAWRRQQMKACSASGQGQAEQRREVRWAVLVVARYSPVRFVCFPQCLAASALLASRGIPSRLHYGVRRGAARLETHTWLEAAGDIVIGGEVAGDYTLLEVY